MTDITTGCIDPRSLGCDAMACAVFEEHARGRTVRQIARTLKCKAGTVQAIIADVWATDKRAARHARRIARKEG